MQKVITILQYIKL